MKKIYFIRHGDVDTKTDAEGRKLVYPPDAPLSLTGIDQLKKVANRLLSEGISLDAIFSSPFTRALQSAQILLAKLHVPVFITLKDLMDVNKNSWVGQPLEDYAKIGGDIYSHPLSADQETLQHLLQRAQRALRIIGISDYESIGVVSHGDLLSGVDWMLKTPEEVPTYTKMKNRFYLQKGQVAEYTLGKRLRIEGQVRLITVDEVQLSRELFRGRV
ncbi:histidine phosphatase family protein [Candidatus Roizmanbacteria bacterium]|nr:histidine phosphatase family protein [Candidatus Roizmanbacteria bacterium]